MKYWILGLLNLAFFSVTATAFPHISQLNQIGQQADPNCNQSASNGLGDLIHKIAADAKPVYEDNRKSGWAGAAAAGMKLEEYKRSQETTGYVSCPGTKYGNPQTGSGALVGPGNQILTSAHLFIDENGVPREPLSECVFQTQANPAQRRKLNFTTKDLYKLFTSYPKGDLERDLALVRIVETDKPITKFKPFPIASSIKFEKNTPIAITMISASHSDLDNNPKFPATAPIIQSCGYQDKTRIAGGGRRIDGLYSDCNASAGASGSIQMIRDENGELAIAAITTQSGKTPQCKYDLANGCHTFATEITAGIVSEINEFQLANANTRSRNQGSSLGL